MLNRFAHALLVSTALAPAALVHGLAFLPGTPRAALAWIGVAALLVLACLAVLGTASRRGERREVAVEREESVDRDVLAFLVAYALPLAAPAHAIPARLAFWAFVAIVAAVLYQAELVHVNPLLGILGWRFREVPRAGRSPALLVTRRRAAGPGTRRVVTLSDGLWLEVP